MQRVSMIEHPMDGGESCEMDRLSTVHPGNEHWQRGATTIHRHPRILEDRRRGRSDAANSTSTSRCWPIIIFHYSGEAVHHRSSRGSSATRYHLHEALITCRPTALHRHSTQISSPGRERSQVETLPRRLSPRSLHLSLSFDSATLFSLISRGGR